MSNRRSELVEAMARVAQGERSALEKVYQMTSGKLFATIVRVVRGRERAEDLLQEVYVKVWHRAGRYDPAKGSPISWLCTVARNTALNDLRRESRSTELAGDELPEVADESLVPADDWLCDAEEYEALAHCLDQLQDDHRLSIKLAYFDGFSHSELAEKLDVPLGTMKSWIRRGLIGLKGCLNG